MKASVTAVNIAGVIADVYQQTQLPMPTVDHAITPLADLLDYYGGLVYLELPHLSSQAALHHLLRQRAIANIPDEIEMNRDPLAGFLYSTPTNGIIFVEENDILVRRRFTVAHEFGHYLLHRPLLSTSDDEEQFLVEVIAETTELESGEEALVTGHLTFNRSSMVAQLLPPVEQMEQEANRFSVELLMPEEVVRDLVAEYASTMQEEDLVWRLATEMLVSRAAMRYRLRNLNLF